MELVTTETIISWIQGKVENREDVAPGVYLDAAVKLNVLLSGEHETLYTLQQRVAQKKSELILGGMSVAQAKSMVEASEDYKVYNIQKAKIERIVEFIRLAKHMSRMKLDEMKGY